jgi:tetratricopeptide (TPR) repeat protein
MSLVIAIIIAASFAMIVFHYWRRVAGAEELSRGEWIEFRHSLIKGVIVPLAAWCIYNLGLLGQPVWPEIVPVSEGLGAWWRGFSPSTGAALLFISTYWAALAMAVLWWRAWRETEDPARFRRVSLLWSCLLVPIAAAGLYAGTWAAAGVVITLCFAALLRAVLFVEEKVEIPASYARAEAKIAWGKFEEAEMAIIEELEEHEDDFRGWLMLAELYAKHFRDLAGARDTLLDLCEQPTTTPGQFAEAMHRLADWYLKAEDPVAARLFLKRIGQRYPGSHLDRMAQQRLNTIPSSRDEWLLQQERKPVRVAAVPDEIGAATMLPAEDAAAAAKSCVEALKRNPDDVAARERFARLLGDHLGEPKLAIEQLELLLALGGQPGSRRAEWLVLSGQWHARGLGDLERGRLLFEEVVRDYADTPSAFTAQRKLNLLRLQESARRRAAAQPAALGGVVPA